MPQQVLESLAFIASCRRMSSLMYTAGGALDLLSSMFQTVVSNNGYDSDVDYRFDRRHTRK